MSGFQRFENRLEQMISGVFARTFRSAVQPVEIAARLQKELDSEAKLLSRDKRLVPNEFVVGLSEHDYDKLTPYSKTLIAELAGELNIPLHAGGWARVLGDVTLRADPIHANTAGYRVFAEGLARTLAEAGHLSSP